FEWDVTAPAPDGSTPEVTIAVNNTLDHSDDIALLGAAPIPVMVTLLHADPTKMHTVEVELPVEDGSADKASLSRSPSGAPAGDDVFVQLANEGSATLWLTALQSSLAQDDVKLLAFVDNNPQPAGKAADTIENLTFQGQDPKTHHFQVRAADTPEGMTDRIP